MLKLLKIISILLSIILFQGSFSVTFCNSDFLAPPGGLGIYIIMNEKDVTALVMKYKTLEGKSPSYAVDQNADEQILKTVYEMGEKGITVLSSILHKDSRAWVRAKERQLIIYN